MMETWALSWGSSMILSSVHWQSVRSSSTRLLWNSRFCFHSRSVYGLHHLGAGSRVLLRALGEVVFRALLLLKHHQHSRWAIVRNKINHSFYIYEQRLWQIWVYHSGSLFQWQPFSIFNTRNREGLTKPQFMLKFSSTLKMSGDWPVQEWNWIRAHQRSGWQGEEAPGRSESCWRERRENREPIWEQLRVYEMRCLSASDVDLLDLWEHRSLSIRAVRAPILPEASRRVWMTDLDRVTLCSEMRCTSVWHAHYY